MKLSNAVKKMEKLGTVTENRGFYRVVVNGTVLEVTKNGDMDSVATITTCGINLEKERDVQSDYFPETYHSNLSQAIRHINLI